MTKLTKAIRAEDINHLSDMLNEFGKDKKVFATQVFQKGDKYEALVYYEVYP